MDTEAFSVFAALLALVAMAGTAGLVVVRLLADRGSAAAGDLLDGVHRVRYPLGTLVAASATGGSLYFSEVAGFLPCEFCWYQRIAMYPLVAVLGVASFRPDVSAKLSATVLAVAGSGLAIYHIQLQQFPDQGSSCDPVAPCTAIWVEEFGFVTIPTMALAGFLAILALLWLPRPAVPAEQPDERVAVGV
ncbi:MAG: disulfide bond formation protein B [Actinomycetota bacterium]